MSTKNVSMKTIAAELGVSINTVSHALRDMDDISAELKSRIREKAIELGYMPNHVSRLMKKEERPVVAIVINSFRNLFFNTLCNCLMEEFIAQDEFDFILLYVPAPRADTDVVKRCILQRVDCILSHVPFEREAWKFAHLNNLHIVMVGNNSGPDVPTDFVIADSVQGCRLAARYLVQCGTGGKFLYVGVDYPASGIRYERFSREVESLCGESVLSFNLERDDVNVLLEDIENGYRNIFCFSDATAYDMLAALDKRAVDISKLYPDLHLVAFDGIWQEIPGLRPITTVKTDFHELAQHAYKIVKRRLDHPNAEQLTEILPVIFLKPTLLE